MLLIYGSLLVGSLFQVLTPPVAEPSAGAAAPVPFVRIDAADGAGLNWLHEHGDVIDTATAEDGVTTVHLRVHPTREGQVRARFGTRVHATETP